MDRRCLPDIDLRHQLADRGLECHLLTPLWFFSNGGIIPDLPADAPAFVDVLCEELSPLTSLAYAGRTLTPAHLLTDDLAVTLRTIAEPHDVVACSTLQFVSLATSNPLPVSVFHTRFEAVQPAQQRTGLGRLLYQCIEVWARFLILNDPTVLNGVINSGGDFHIVSVIDKDGDDDNDDDDDNEEGHGTFLKQLGFVRAVHDFGQDTTCEIAFQRDFHIPVDPASPSVTDTFVTTDIEAAATTTTPLSTCLSTASMG